MKIKRILLTLTLGYCASVVAQTTVTDWAFEESFDSNPPSPSQDLLPREFEYVATHRTHPKEHFTKVFDPFLADHDDDCTGPVPSIVPLPQHWVSTTQDSDSNIPDPSFFICRNHMMSSMGEVAAYSNTVFWPRQEFDFSEGGILEFDVNINEGHTQRHWWEILIAPRDQIKFASAPRESAVDETYPRDRIVLDFRNNVRQVRVGKDQFAPDGWDVENRHFDQYDFYRWRQNYPNDPALGDRRIRRTMRIEFTNNQIIWGIQTENGDFDNFVVDVPEGLPFNRGLVQFKTHAYTPAGSGNNFDIYTFHWDNIRFSGPQLAAYQTFAASEVVYLQSNGDRPIGDTKTVTIDLPNDFDRNPVLLGQLHGAIRGQPLLSINGGPDMAVNIDAYRVNDCVSDQWRDWISFRLPLDASQLKPGKNELQWKVGPRPSCAIDDFWWDGFSAKFIHIQIDGDPDSIENNDSNLGWLVPIIDSVIQEDNL
ncbi:MAG: hypothetical protein KTR16_11955 [Acidiferrobacterales bacterium]|nr:hypothetical protein [Acidiferrobacterales bacterium]